jgi:uncharacterized glyoxalase superfamily protein PhnB
MPALALCNCEDKSNDNRNSHVSSQRGEATMARPKAKPVKPGAHPVIPHLVCAGAASAIEFYKKAFGAEEMMRLPGPDGRLMHACITINGAHVFLTDENVEYGAPGPKTLKGSPVFIHLTVKDVDAFAKRAVAAGANSRTRSAIAGRWRRTSRI